MDLLLTGHTTVVSESRMLWSVLTTWSSVWGPVATGSDYLSASCTSVTFLSADLLELSFAPASVDYWVIYGFHRMYSHLYVCTACFPTWTLSNSTPRSDLLLTVAYLAGFRWQDHTTSSVNLTFLCVIQLWWFISILYINKFAEWWLNRTDLCTNCGWLHNYVWISQDVFPSLCLYCMFSNIYSV